MADQHNEYRELVSLEIGAVEIEILDINHDSARRQIIYFPWPDYVFCIVIRNCLERWNHPCSKL
jgi:hypothetical protein